MVECYAAFVSVFRSKMWIGAEKTEVGGDIGVLSDLLGHASIAITKKFYSVFLIEEHRDKHEAFSPVSKLRLGIKEEIEQGAL